MQARVWKAKTGTNCFAAIASNIQSIITALALPLPGYLELLVAGCWSLLVHFAHEPHDRYDSSSLYLEKGIRYETFTTIVTEVGPMKSPVNTPLHYHELRGVAANTSDGSASLPYSELYIVSPPPQNIHKSATKKRTPRLTPPPYSEQINRAIRSAECQLDAAVDDVQRYISQGCPDIDSLDKLRIHVGSPESDYSDDLLSPKELPDFNSPLNGESLSFKSDGYDNKNMPQNSSNQENEEPNTPKIKVQNNSPKETSCDAGEINKEHVRRLRRSDSSPSIEDEISECTNGPAMKGRTLRFDGSRFEVWPPLNCSDSCSSQ